MSLMATMMRRGVAPRTFAPVMAPRRQFSIESYNGQKMFDKILVANRGEIAVRVITTARKMGIKTVAVYSDADANSKHARFADEAYNIGPAASKDSYLRMDKILEVIKKTGAQAVHPGYGFLSENCHFSALLKENGIKFMGPSEFSIDAMGDKIHSKKLAREAEVNTIPGYAGVLESVDDILRVSNEIGYPVMIKATAGGGGKGMRIASNDAEARDAFRLSKQEAMSSFGDDRMFVEKFVEEPRHIEFQIVMDSHGNGVYLPERECSIQRRNQKVLEEAPSVVLDEAQRKAMGEQAIQMARAVQYESAGTVEFLVDKHKNFYFLEMNTRLQVEHPITEMISGQDLVAHMIAVAAGHKLSITQDDVSINGHAVEARVYAEDPFRNYLPSIGRLRRYQEPTGPGVRCDSGILEGSEITMYYDPMVCKTCTHAPDRQGAIEKMRHALDTYVIEGVTHNIPLLRAVLDHPRFLDGSKITTKFLEEEYPDGFHGNPMDAPTTRRLAALTSLVQLLETRRSFTASAKPLPPTMRLLFGVDGSEMACEATLEAENADGSSTVTVQIFEGQDANAAHVETIALNTSWRPGSRVLTAQVEGTSDIEHIQIVGRTVPGYVLEFRGTKREVTLVNPRTHALLKHMPAEEKLDVSKFLMSPMPGLIKSVAVKEGDMVTLGQELIVMEAMKMQNILRSTKDTRIKAVRVAEGDDVKVDEILIEYEDE